MKRTMLISAAALAMTTITPQALGAAPGGSSSPTNSRTTGGMTCQHMPRMPEQMMRHCPQMKQMRDQMMGDSGQMMGVPEGERATVDPPT